MGIKRRAFDAALTPRCSDDPEEWQMNGKVITKTLTPIFKGGAVSPDVSFSTQARPTNFG
jgi:hypothetical protein